MTGWDLDNGDTIRIAFTRGEKVTDVVDLTYNFGTNRVEISRPDEE